MNLIKNKEVTNVNKRIITGSQNHELSVEQAMEQLKDLPYHNMEYAKLDYHRQLRTGFSGSDFRTRKNCCTIL